MLILTVAIVNLDGREWLDMWRASWPEGHTLDPHDPESFGFAFVGTVTGAHGVNGDVRVRADDFLCDQGGIIEIRC